MIFDRKTDVHSEIVTDTARGTLYASRTGIFIDAFKFDVSVGPAPTRIVQVPGASPFEVSLTLPTSERLSVEHGHHPPPGRFRLMSANINRRRNLPQGSQFWFSGAKDEAASVLRGLLNDAQREVLIVDPYFGAEELYGFPLAVARIDVQILVLTSAEFLREDAGGGLEAGDALLVQLNHVSSLPQTNKITVRVMKGSRPSVHDRFFVVDDRVWLLGASLNEFGSRGTMVVALPDPAPVREQLVAEWSDAEDLGAWIAARKERQREIAGGTGQ